MDIRLNRSLDDAASEERNQFPSMCLLRWTPVALWTSTSGALARLLPTGDLDRQTPESTKARSWMPASLLAGSRRVLNSSNEALQQLRSSSQSASQPEQHREDEQEGSLVNDAENGAENDASNILRTAGLWRWLPWRTTAADQSLQAAQVHLPSP